MPDVAASASGQRATSAQIWRRRGIDLVSVLVPTVLFALARTVDSNLLLLVSMMVYVVLAQGVNVIYGFTGYLPFGYVGFFGAGAYGAYVAVAHLGASGAEATALGGVAAVLVAVVLIPLLRLRGAYFAIASLAAALALSSIVSNPATTSVTNGPYGADLTRVFSSGGSYYAAVVIVALAMVSVVALRRSRLGLLLRAVRADQVSASCAGVNVVAVRTGAWLLSALLAGLAGAVYAWSISVFYPTAVFDTTISLFAIVFALFGGVGTVLGPVVGAVALYYVYNAIGVNDPQYFQLIFGVVIVVVALFLPGGLAALALGARRRLGARRGLRAQPLGGSDVR